MSERADIARLRGSVGIWGPLKVTETRDQAALRGYDGAQGSVGPVERADIARLKGSAGIWGPLKVTELRDAAAAQGSVGTSGQFASTEKADRAKGKGYSGSWGPLRVTGTRDQMVARAVRGLWGQWVSVEVEDRANFKTGGRFSPQQSRETVPMPSNVSGQTGASPREYNLHQRYSSFAKRRYDNQLAAYLAAQATRLSSTSAVIFAKVTKYGAQTVSAAASLAAIP